MPRPLSVFSQSDYLNQVVDINSHTEWQTVQIKRSQLIWIYSVCKGRIYPGSAGQGLIKMAKAKYMYLVILVTLCRVNKSNNFLLFRIGYVLGVICTLCTARTLRRYRLFDALKHKWGVLKWKQCSTAQTMQGLHKLNLVMPSETFLKMEDVHHTNHDHNLMAVKWTNIPYRTSP